MNSKHADNNKVEEIFEEFTVTSNNPKEQIGVYEVNRHINTPSQQDIEKARAEGYVLGPNMKTFFTIKAFKGYRVINDMIKQIAVEYSNGDIQWVDKDILKYGEAQDSLWCYLNKLNTQIQIKIKNKRRKHIE